MIKPCPVYHTPITYVCHPKREIDKSVLCNSCLNTFEIAGSTLIKINGKVKIHHDYMIKPHSLK